MADVQTIADAYIAAWNEADPGQRRQRLSRGWAEDATHVELLAQVAGRDDISAMIGGAQARFPGFSFRLKGPASGYGDHVRFSWSLGPAGAEAPIERSHVVSLEDGRIAQAIGFLDKVP